MQGMLLRDGTLVTTYCDRLAELRETYETYKGSLEGTLFYEWTKLCTRPEPAALHNIQAVLHQLDRTNNWALLPLYMTCAAELTGHSGDAGTAVILLQRASEIADFTGSRWCDAEIMRLKARFLARDAEEATGLLGASLAIAKEQRAKLWELRASITLAELLSGQGNYPAACELLKPIYEAFIKGGSSSDSETAQSFLYENKRTQFGMLD